MKRILRPMLFLPILIVVIVLSVLHHAITSKAAAPSITEQATSVPAVSNTAALSFFKPLKPNYMLFQGGPAASSLVGEWRFDEANGTSAADSSGRSLNGTLQNGAVWASGRYRAGMKFDGVNDYVQVGAQPALVMTNAMTISAWINPTGTGAAGLGIIVNKEGEYEIARFSDGTIRWALANSSPGWTFVDTGFVAPVNQWTHIALTYNNGEVKTYANGNLVHSYLGSGAIGDVGTSTNDFRIGGRQSAEQNFMGLLDEVSIYNQALSATEVTKLSQGSTLRNLALRKPATQSSTGYDSPASLAVDGNTDGDWYHGSVSHTNENFQAWWQVDLGSVQQIDNVSVFMMTICCSSHDNFDVKVSSDGTNWTSYYVAGPINQTNVPVNRAARYVRVQLRGSNYLALAEVQVWGVPGAVMPGVVQAEDFDEGGEGISYHDLTPANEGGLYRSTAVDVASCVANNYVIGWNGSGEWTQYSINVLTSGNYTFEAVIGSESATGSLHVEIDGVNKSGPVTIPATGSFCTYQTISKGQISLSAGQHTMRVVTDNIGVVLDSFRLVAASPATAPNAAAFVSQSVPTSMVAGQVYNVSVTMQNTGSNTWTTTNQYKLGTQNPQDNSTWGLTRVFFPSLQPIAPGQQVTFTFPIQAPGTAGTYNFQMRMVQDGVEWFGALTPNVVVTVAAPNQPPKASASAAQVGLVGNPVSFSSDGSSDPDGTIASYSWNFGDGQTSSAANTTHTYSYGGNYVVTLTVTDNGGATATATTSVAVVESTQSAYNNGTGSTVPGTIQAEDYDNGGPEVAYHDDTISNLGGSGTYRASENVDIENNTASNAGYAVGWARAGEWVEYFIRVADTDNYKLDAQVASPLDGGTGGVFHVEFDGANKTGPITVPGTGGAWTTVTKSGIKLTAGTHVMRIVMDSGGSTGFVGRFDYFKFTPTQSPYGGTARALPGTFQAEDFDNGEAGTAYSDGTPGNQGGAYRSTDVDIWNSSEGPALGWTQKGEWVDYTVDVSQKGSYTLAARVSSPGAGAKFHIEVDGFDATGQITVPATGSRDVWQTVQASLRLTSGRHILRLVVDEVGAGGEVCFNSFDVPTPKGDPIADAALGPQERFDNVDYATVGLGNLWNSGGGTLNLRNTKNVSRAYLYWWGTLGFFNPQIVNFANRQIIGTPMATSNPGSYIFGSQSFTFRADVTGIIQQFGNVNYGLNVVNCYGASLVVIYDDDDDANNRDIMLYTGNDSNANGFLSDEPGWNSVLDRINYPGSGQAILQLHVAEGEVGLFEAPLVVRNAFNVTNIYPTTPFFDPPGADLFRGNTVPPNFDSGLWDIMNFDVTRLLIGGTGNVLFVQAGLRRDVLFIALAVVNVPHPPPPPSVKITEATGRVSGELNNTTRNALIGGQIILKATGNSSKGSYAWTFTGPVEGVVGNQTDTVTFRTKDDGTLKNVYPVTAKVTFTNSVNAKADATVNINVNVPTLPEYTGTQGAQTLEQTAGGASPIVWQIGSSNSTNPQAAMTFNARAQIPAGPYLSNPAESSIHFEQAISTMRKVRDSWGRVSCKTSRFTQTDVASGWQGDIRAVSLRSFANAEKSFAAAVPITGGLSLGINVREGVEGLKFRLSDVDAAKVDDRYETYVVYESNGFSRRLGSVQWRWGGTLAFDTTPDPRNLQPEPNIYKLKINNAMTGTIQQDLVVSTRQLTSVNTTLSWGQCRDEHAQPLDFRLVDNQHHYVQELYRDFFKRELRTFDDVVGYHFWASNITQYAFDEAAIDGHHVQVALGFIFSGEYVTLHQGENDLLRGLSAPLHTEDYNRAFVKACYFAFLHRDDPLLYPNGFNNSGTFDPEINDFNGFNHWFQELNSQNQENDWSGYFEVVHAFLISEEYLDRYFDGITDDIDEDFDNPAPNPPQQ